MVATIVAIISGSDDFFEKSSDYSSDYIFGKSSSSGSGSKKI